MRSSRSHELSTSGPHEIDDPLRAGRDVLFRQVMERFHQELFAFIRNRVRNDDIARDLLQDTYVKALQKLGTITDEGKLAGWLFRIAANTVTDHFRKQRPEGPMTDLPEDGPEPPLNSKYIGCLPGMLEELDAKYSEALRMVLKDDLPQHVIADRLGISHTSAKSRIQRARAKLEALFRERCNYTADVYGNIIEDDCAEPCGCEGA
jgi:RNA polymerase sigma-70 factor, ECF subfamily